MYRWVCSMFRDFEKVCRSVERFLVWWGIVVVLRCHVSWT